MTEFDRRDPPYDLPEKQMLEAWLDYHRATLLRKVDGLSDEQLRRIMVPSGVCLLGLVKHLAWVERDWFRIDFAGEDLPVPWSRDDPNADFRIEPDEATGDILEFYRTEVRRSREIAASASLDDVARRSGQHATMRWIMNHMIEETARHNGHADIFRELIDGKTGE